MAIKFFVIAILFFSSGCASVLFQEKDRLAMGGQYSELERAFEGEYKDISSAKSVDLIGLCNTYSKLKKYNKLFSCLEQLENNIKKGDKIITHYGWFSWSYPQNITVIPDLLKAEAYIELGDYDKAVASAKKAYELLPTIEWSFKDRHNSWERRCKIRSLGILALAYALKGDNKNASQYAVQLENEGMGFWGFMNTPGGVTLAIEKEKSFGLARAYMALGQYDKILTDKGGIVDALGSFTEGYVGVTFFAFVDLPKQFIINKALYETGHIKEAKEGYDRLLSKPETKSNGEIYWPILFDRGRISQAEGNTKQGIEFYRQSVDVIETQRSTINTEAFKIGFVGDKQKVYHQMISTLYSDGQYANAFEYVERSKARALVDLLASNKDFVIKDSREQVASMLKEIETIETEGKALDVSSFAADKIYERNTRSVQIKEKVKTIAPELSSLIAVSIPHSSEIQSYIQSDETLIEYYYHGEDLYAFVLTRNELKTVKLDGKEIIKDMEDFRKSLQDPKSQEYIELSKKLHQKLIKPVESFINTQKLIIVPHGVLHYLPFNALNSGSDYLIDKYSVSYLPSASVMKFLKQKKKQKTESVLIFGNPDLDDPKYDLKYAGEEAVAISKELPHAKVLLRKDATETNFKKSASQFNYIHFATHGSFESDSPLNSGLFLSKDAENDGLLSVNELYSTSLNADLVTLSACETALGKINAGDDVVGLQRGFLYAGANSIVASLWKVDDMATAQIMTEFYSNLKKTNKRDALRKAQLVVKKQYEHPFFWAAFQLTGIGE
ncbi:MAG: CHAT domain-containing protein [Deltaproteobacteria bacterium]|nr:CHAT domain-containing protein [Deltaproteobacteria bacterium]